MITRDLLSFDNVKLQTVDSDLDKTISGVYIGDLLSLVMAKAKAKNIWITIQTHLNIMAIAELLDLSGIIIAENMEIDANTLEKANELKIPIFKTNNSAYEIACKLYEEI